MRTLKIQLYLFMLALSSVLFTISLVNAEAIDFGHSFVSDTVYWDGWPPEWMFASYTFVLLTDYTESEYIYQEHYACAIDVDKSSFVDIDATYIHSQGIRNGYAFIQLYVKGTCCTSKYIRHEGRCDNWELGSPIWSETTW